MNPKRFLTTEDRNRFFDRARTMIEADVTSAYLRVTLAEEFGMSLKQVQNLLNRNEIKTGGLPTPANKIRDMAPSTISELVEAAKSMMSSGIDPAMIKAKLTVRFGVRESDVTCICKSHGFHLSGYVNPKGRGEPDHEVIPLEKADLSIENNLFMKAAQKVDGAQYIPGKGCFLNGVRINGFALAMKANLQNEVWQ